MDRILTIGIAGGTGSGKTTITRRLQRQFEHRVCTLYHDNYYHAHDHLTMEERSKLNYDEPAAFETDLLVEHLARLRAGQRTYHSVLCARSCSECAHLTLLGQPSPNAHLPRHEHADVESPRHTAKCADSAPTRQHHHRAGRRWRTRMRRLWKGATRGCRNYCVEHPTSPLSRTSPLQCSHRHAAHTSRRRQCLPCTVATFSFSMACVPPIHGQSEIQPGIISK